MPTGGNIHGSQATAVPVQPLAVTYIDNRLPDRIPAFAGLPAHYDADRQQYVPNSHTVDPNALSMRPRPDAKDSSSKPMEFWHGIFGAAMEQFKSTTKEPKSQAERGWSIRDKTNWDDIYSLLLLARNMYLETKGSLGLGALRKVRRKAADVIGPLAEASKMAAALAPKNPYSTPVLGAIEVVLEVVKTAAAVRNQVLEGLDSLVDIFSQVEFFLGTFPQDVNITRASTSLVVSTFEATERVIGFFTSNEFLRGGKALFQRKDYQKALLDSLGAIETQSQKLLEEATKSHFYEFHVYSQEAQKTYHHLGQGQERLLDGLNTICWLMSEHLSGKRQIERLQVENAMLRSHSPILLFSPYSAPASPAPMMAEWVVNQDTLRQILDMADVDLSDLDFVNDRKHQLPPRERARAEQVVNAAAFRHWITAPSSAELMVHWDQCRQVANVSSLTVLCTTMAAALKVQSGPFLSALWFCGRHHDRAEVQSDAFLGPRAMLKSLIDQLLRQYMFDMPAVSRCIDVTTLQRSDGDLDAPGGLLALLKSLLLQLPPAVTLFFVIDGVVLYEREQFVNEAIVALGRLSSFTVDARVRCTVKVLWTSAPSADVFAFGDDNSKINVASIPLAELVPSEERLVRELSG